MKSIISIYKVKEVSKIPLEIAALAAVLLFLCGMSSPEGTQEVETRFTEIIMRVQPDVIIMPEGRYKAAIHEIQIDSQELKNLNKQFNVISIERMFTKKQAEKAGEEYREEETLEEDAEKPDLENVFLFIFPDLIDPADIIEAYGKVKEVIYVEKNQSVGIF